MAIMLWLSCSLAVELILKRKSRIIKLYTTSKGHGSIVWLLLIKGANREAKDRFNKSLLIYIAKQKNICLVSILWEARSSPSILNKT